MILEPLSQSLRQAVTVGTTGEAPTLNRLLDRTGGRGIHLVIILLCLPFITPVPLPGVSTVFGAIILVLSLRQALQLPPRLPKFIGERPLRFPEQDRILQASLRFLNFVERAGRPRIGVGTNTYIENAIVDKNARIGSNCVITPNGKPENLDHPLYFIRDGIVIVPKNGTIPHGTII